MKILTLGIKEDIHSEFEFEMNSFIQGDYCAVPDGLT